MPYFSSFSSLASEKKWMKMTELEENSGDVGAGRDLDFLYLSHEYFLHICVLSDRRSTHM